MNKFIANLDGLIFDKASYKEHIEGIHLSLGVYETMLYYNGCIEFENNHWIRLFKGFKVLELDIPKHWDVLFFKNEIDKTIHKEFKPEDLLRIRLQIFKNEKSLSYIIEILAIDINVIQWNEDGLNVSILPNYFKPINELGNYKLSHSSHIQPSKLFLNTNLDIDEVLLLNAKQRIVESSIANVFIVKKQAVYTPSLNESCLDGVMRRHIIDTLKKNNILILEQEISQEFILQADEVFISNSIRRIKWIKKIDQVAYSNVFGQFIYSLIKVI